MPPCRTIERTLPDGSVCHEKVFEWKGLWLLDAEGATILVSPVPPLENLKTISVPKVGRRSK